MNDIKFIEALKQRRNACDYSQSRLAQELQISRQNLNEIENGKTKASKEMKHILLYYLDYCNCTQPFTLTIDYLRVRFPTTDVILSRLVDTFISRISLTMLPVPNPHNTVCVLSWEEARHWQSRSSGYSSS